MKDFLASSTSGYTLNEVGVIVVIIITELSAQEQRRPASIATMICKLPTTGCR